MTDDENDSPNSNTPPVTETAPSTDPSLGAAFGEAVTAMKVELEFAEAAVKMADEFKAIQNAIGKLPMLKLKFVENSTGEAKELVLETEPSAKPITLGSSVFEWDHPAKALNSGALTIDKVEMYEKWRKEHGARSRKKSEERPTETKKSKWITEG